MQVKNWCDRSGASLRDTGPAPADFLASMWDSLSAVERAEYEQLLRPQADAWAAAHPKRKWTGS
jgi:hypothetical protein